MGMCGGGSNKAQQQADRNAQAQQQQTDLTTRKINSIFSDPARQAQYNQLATDTTNYYKQELDRQQQQATRSLKFSLARSGLTGSSVQAGEAQNLGQDYQRGLLDAQRRGISAADSLRSADQSAKAQLMGEAQSGLNMGTAEQQANSALQSGLANAQDNATVNQIGNMFSDISNRYSNSVQQANNRRAYTQGFNLYTPMTSGGYRP